MKKDNDNDSKFTMESFKKLIFEKVKIRCKYLSPYVKKIESWEDILDEDTLGDVFSKPYPHGYDIVLDVKNEFHIEADKDPLYEFITEEVGGNRRYRFKNITFKEYWDFLKSYEK